MSILLSIVGVYLIVGGLVGSVAVVKAFQRGAARSQIVLIALVFCFLWPLMLWLGEDLSRDV